jgi:hypothetical protein
MFRRLIAALRGPAPQESATTPPAPEPPTFARQLGARDAGEWIRARLDAPVLYSTLSGEAIARLRQRQSSRVDATIAAAEKILRHDFDLLGSGTFRPVDPDRRAVGPYAPIDWYLDPVRGLRFPRGIPYKEWRLYDMRPGNADIKYPWELARCQHWAVLGQAFLFTKDERFAQEIASELDDFVEANPVGIGVNWTCTMDVALRALSWAIGLELVRTSSSLDEAFWIRAYRALFDTGAFTRANLENNYEVTSNHFLSNVVGLWFLGAVFEDLPSGREWLAFARAALEQEMEVQVLPDGADYESSVPYHRLVAELFLGSSRLADVRGEPLSEHYRARLRAMIDFLAGITRPDGLMPQVGDADDGRLHLFTSVTTPQDPRHLLGPAGVMFDDPSWVALGGEDGRWEAAWWGLDAGADVRAAAPARSRLFPDAGLAVMHANRSYLLVTNGIVGTKGFGNHKHNDQLSFEYHHDGVPLVVDPGSFVYTSDFDARNRFRGTRVHNTIAIDDVEQNDLKPEWIFRLFESSLAEHVRFDDDPQSIAYTGRHHGYERLAGPVLHERTLRLSKADGSMVVIDRLAGAGVHRFRWHFHLAPGVTAERGDSHVLLRAQGRSWRLSHATALQTLIQPAEYSPSYGVKQPCVAIEFEIKTSIDGEQRWEFGLGPEAA